MHFYEEAVGLALNFDIEFAKIMAEKPHREEDRKVLWLRIARHVVEEEKDISKSKDNIIF